MAGKHISDSLREETRRRFLHRLGQTALAACAANVPGLAQARDDPPVFETARHQFTIIEPRKPVPPVAFQRLDGHSVHLTDWCGKVVLLNFWASWCLQCRTELPMLDRLQASLDPARYQVVAVSTDREGKPAIEPYLKKFDIKHLALGLDPDGTLGRPMPTGGSPDLKPSPFTIYGMPMTYLIDPSGRACGYMVGAADWASPEARALLKYYEGA